MLEWRIAEKIEGDSEWRGSMFLENLTYVSALECLAYMRATFPTDEYRIEFRRIPEWEPYF